MGVLFKYERAMATDVMVMFEKLTAKTTWQVEEWCVCWVMVGMRSLSEEEGRAVNPQSFFCFCQAVAVFRGVRFS